MKIKGMKVVIAGVTLVLLIVLVWQIVQSVTTGDAYTLEEAEAQELNQYRGEIRSATASEDVYQFIVDMDTGIYELHVKKDTGEITKLSKLNEKVQKNGLSKEKIEEITLANQQGDIQSIVEKEKDGAIRYEVVVKHDNQQSTVIINEQGEVIDTITEQTEEAPQKVRLLTEEEARQIALDHVNGDVDDVDYEESEGLAYFLVEIEERDDREATIQINAISGEVMAISWDD